MSNIPGDSKPREVVEDTAVDVRDLPSYITEFDSIMREKHKIECVYYAHAGTGELHTRPLFNLKTAAGVKMFRSVAEDIAKLVRKFNGSLSGEHGDGRLRGEFIPLMVGDACYELMKSIKKVFDPLAIFNPGKIIDSPPMDSSLRSAASHPAHEYPTIFDFSSTLGMVRAVEQCNGSGDCRKGPTAGGAMCPSYMATHSEKHVTRGRANILRHALLDPVDSLNPFNNDEVKEVMDLCLSCKACKSECPSNVDMAKLKAEFLQHYYDARGVPLRSRMVGSFAQACRLASTVPSVWNLVFGTPSVRRLANRVMGFHPDRSIPLLHRQTLSRWHSRRKRISSKRRVYLFCDEFTEYNDVPIGRKSILLLERLGYEVIIPRHLESGRSKLSKGLIREAQKIATANIQRLAPLVSESSPLVGVEPSAIFSFRDEYVDLAPTALRSTARDLAHHCFTIEEFISREFSAGRISADAFTTEHKRIHLHGHCFQKAFNSITPVVKALEIPENYTVTIIPSGCCGMAGSFGYEKEHFAISNTIAELVLLPAVRKIPSSEIVAASGTSCRHQIHDGTTHAALHPAEVLFDALS